LVAKLEPYLVTMYHTCRINGMEFVLPHRTGDLTIATNLSPSQRYTIWCGRNTEAVYGKTVLQALLVDAGTQMFEPQRQDDELRVEFVGDSITAGWLVLNDPGSYVNQNQTGEDIFQTWDRHLADAWGTSNWRAVARTGIAIFPYTAYGLQFHRIKDRFLCSEFSYSQCCPNPWDFNKWQADVVVINVGTNDYIPVNPNKPSAATFAVGYGELLLVVRSKYPHALILCIMPLAYTCDSQSRYDAMCRGLTEAVRDAEDEKIRLHLTGTRQAPWLNCNADYVDGTHPTIAGGKKFADRLLPGLTPQIRQFFPEKCRGIGSRCQSPAPVSTSLQNTLSTTDKTTSAASTVATTGLPSTTAASGSRCCYPNCRGPQSFCNTETESPFCTSSAENCQQCGGELCGGGSQTTAAPPSSTTGRTIPASTTTTSEGTESTSGVPGGAVCCYPDCGAPQNQCNTERDSPFCTSSAANCRGCGGELCSGGGGGAQTSAEPTTTTTW
ncbi:celE, partial [Symbiodinium pilosum]